MLNSQKQKVTRILACNSTVNAGRGPQPMDDTICMANLNGASVLTTTPAMTQPKLTALGRTRQTIFINWLQRMVRNISLTFRNPVIF